MASIHESQLGPPSPSQNEYPMSHEDRLVRIESALMELQRHVELLNEALLNQQKDFHGIQSQIRKIESLAAEWSDPLSSPVDERPPHY